MSKTTFKVISLTVLLAIVLVSLPTRLAQAAGEPAAPSDLAAQPGYPGDLSISLTWTDNSSDETTWQIERCIGAGCTDFTLLATRDATIWGPWFTDTGLAEITSYSYRVRATNAFGASAYSNSASGTTSYARPDGQLTSLLGTLNNGVVELTWTENATNETRFEIERYEVGAGGTVFVVIGTVAPDTTSFVDSTALYGTIYDYRVVPWRYDVSGGAPIVVNVQTGTGIAAPTSLKAAVGSANSVRISWKGKFDAGTQVVVQRENCDIYGCYGWLTIGQVDASSGRFNDTGLSPATTYTYRIRAITSTSVSPWTNSVVVTTRR